MTSWFSPRCGRIILITLKKCSSTYKIWISNEAQCEFFKSQVHYLGFLVGTQGVQPLPEKVATIKALEPSKDIDELRQFLGLVGFYRKIIPFFTDVMACPNTMLRKVQSSKWTEQCGNAFRLLKSDLVKMPKLQYPNPNKPFMLFTYAFRYSPSRGVPHHLSTEVNLIPTAYFQAHLVRPSSCGSPPKRSVMPFTGPFKSAHYTVITNH